MIIPMRCMNCGKLLADKWTWYQSELERKQGSNYGNRTYFDGRTVPHTVEQELLNQLGLTRYCCKKVFLTHPDFSLKL